MGSNFGEVDIEFDFEATVHEVILPPIAETPSTQNTFGLGNFGKVDPKLRTVVCLYWLDGLCQKVSDHLFSSTFPNNLSRVRIALICTN
jgi:hypothetical protein